MIQITPQMRIWVAVEPVDFRRGIDGLAALCRQKLKAEPMSGAVFVFGSSRRKSIKILIYDGQGFILYQNMHDPHCAVIESRKNPLPSSSLVRPRVGGFRRCWR